MPKKSRRPHIIISLSLAVSASIFRLALDEEILPPPSTTFVQAEEIFDNNDWEIQLTTSDGQTMTTSNEVDDRFPQFSDSLAVWQRLGDAGWEIVSWKTEHQERVVTENSVDDTEPATDGTYIVWQSLVDDRWQIFRLEESYLNGDPEQLSEDGVNNLHPRIASELTTWQAWIDNNWEIMTWSSIDGLSRLTINDQPDLEPDISDAFIVWEGVDPAEGDRDIFAVDRATDTELIMTDNRSNDSGAEVDGDGQVVWFAEGSSNSQSTATTDLAEEFSWQQANGQLIEVAPTQTEEVATTDETLPEVNIDEESSGPTTASDESTESSNEETSSSDENLSTDEAAPAEDNTNTSTSDSSNSESSDSGASDSGSNDSGDSGSESSSAPSADSSAL